MAVRDNSASIIIIGGGIIGLSLALELHQRGIAVTVVSRSPQEAASEAAAGMLAPRAEALTGGLLTLGRRSLAMYGEWTRKLTHFTGLETGYDPCGILVPTEAVPVDPTDWLPRAMLSDYQGDLGPAIAGAYWYADEGQVDNRQLMTALRQAVRQTGIDYREGVAVTGWEIQGDRLATLLTTQGAIRGDRYVLAAGAWSRQLLPLPLRPLKGQMLALQMPQPRPLERVIFGPGIYLVPRRDGRLVIGATQEEVNWTPHTTPQGLGALFTKAMNLYPPLARWPLLETWWGYRPATPDEGPLLGASPYANLILATGHHRNGILLAPITAQLIADLITEGTGDPLLTTFSYQRFYSHHPQTKPMTVSQPLPSVTPTPEIADTPLIIAGRSFRSRLMTGSGKYSSVAAMQGSILASGCEIVTVAVRRVQTQAPGHEGLAEAIDWSKIWMLPNTAGCQNAEEAIRVARLGREMAKLLGQEDNNFVKLEVIPDLHYLLPDPIETLKAAEQLVKEGFAVLPYINADPLLAKHLEEAGCATVMPLGSPIGSGQGIRNLANIQIIIEQAKIPVVIDAGIGAPSEAAQGMELGADALLVNSAIALAQHPIAMAHAMGQAAAAGRLAYLAGRMPRKQQASASSPLTGLVTQG